MKDTIKQSILSGFLVGIGVVINTQIENKYIGAMLFSLALLTIIECDLKLYTGKIGFIKYIVHKCDLIQIFVFNLIGVLIPILIYSTKNDFLNKIINLSNIKFSNTYLELFLYGLMCGVLMFIAVYCKKTVITIFCIMVFILSGYEHCIADFPFLCVNFNLENLLKFICVVLGNSFGSIITIKLIR